LIVFAALSFVSSGAAQTATTFGPKQYTRGQGATQSFSETFSRCAGGSCQLVIINGNPDGSNRVATPGLNWRPNSAKDDVAISLATGGGGSYADNAVGFLNDFVLYQTTSSNATESNNVPQYRYGDYFDIRNAVGPETNAGQGVGFSTLAYAVTQSVTGNIRAVSTCNVTLQYVLFGRNSDLFPTPTPPIR
jgi:hypothetical protein